MLSGYKKFSAYLTAVAWMLVNHYVFKKPDPDLDKLIATVSMVYAAIEAAKDAVVAFANRLKPADEDEIPRLPVS